MSKQQVEFNAEQRELIEDLVWLARTQQQPVGRGLWYAFILGMLVSALVLVCAWYVVQP